MKQKIFWVVLILLVLVALIYIATALKKSAPPIKAGTPPVVEGTPAKVYGVVEPLGREVFVSPTASRRVVEILVKEGDTIRKDQILCVLEHDVEEENLAVAEAKIKELKSQSAIAEEILRRNTELIKRQVIAVSEFKDSQLLFRYRQRQLEGAYAESALAKAQFEQLYLKSPIDGIVYKFDIRIGETFQAGDNTRIILGPPQRQVRLFVEVFWMDRIRVGSRYELSNVETGEKVGFGTVITVTQYVGRRDFRTEDAQERLDTKYQQVVLSLNPGSLTQPKIGLAVVATLPP
jgi:multidrug efflux pump subunit AcrA (membrane-fusion protein)